MRTSAAIIGTAATTIRATILNCCLSSSCEDRTSQESILGHSTAVPMMANTIAYGVRWSPRPPPRFPPDSHRRHAPAEVARHAVLCAPRRASDQRHSHRATGQTHGVRNPGITPGKRPLACRFLLYTDAIAIGGTVHACSCVSIRSRIGVADRRHSIGARRQELARPDVQDVTKAEADKLKWGTPHGAKVGVVASGSPAEKAGLKSGDFILSIDRMVIDTSSEANAAVAAKRPGDAILLQVLSNGNEHRVNVTLAEQPKIQAAQDQGGPLLMLDTGGHMAVIKGLAFAPDGKQLVSAGDDKVIRVWDWQAGKTIRTIHGQVGPGNEGNNYAMALSPDARWVAVGGWMDTTAATTPCCGDIRLYDFVSGKLVALLKGHADAVAGLAFSPDGKRLISCSGVHKSLQMIKRYGEAADQRRCAPHQLKGVGH
jgi:PDZ domain/WD domain, G-beta repeat